MGQEYQKESEKVRRYPCPFLFAVFGIVVATNVVFLYSTASYYHPGGLKFSSDDLLARLMNATRDDVRLNHELVAKLLRATREDAVLASDLLVQLLNATRMEALMKAEQENVRLRADLKTLHEGTERVIQDRTQQIWDELMSRPFCESSTPLPGQGGVDPVVAKPWIDWSKGHMHREMKRFVEMRSLPLGRSSTLQRDSIISPVGHACALMKQEVDRFMDYGVGKECPDDETVAQALMVGGCEPLPRRRCKAVIPKNYSEPYPVPEAYWRSPPDSSVIWTAHSCKSYECLEGRVKNNVFADCLDCFNLKSREKDRWLAGGDLDFAIQAVLAFKKSTIRIGLDIGGGTASFAVRMKEHDVTIVSTTLNLNGPFNNFVASRGVIPIYMTVSQRFPFFDNTLDIVHSMHVLSNWLPTETLEFILYDIDRILRPGGLFWLDHFFCVKSQLATYVPLIEALGHTKLKWVIGDKLDRGVELQEVYISALLEKPLARD